MLSRRFFIKLSCLAALAGLGPAALARRRYDGAAPPPADGPVVIASGNGKDVVKLAYDRLVAGADPLDAAVDGVAVLENDPDEQGVGLGGLPNEEGVVELDASVMHGPTHRAGAVAGLQRIKNPAQVAREVARRTDHVLLVGDGALRFARRMGFQEENLLTEKSRLEWLKWRASLNRDDNWLQDDQLDLPVKDAAKRSQAGPAMLITGTVHCSVRTAGADLAGATSTSGLSWKFPGRVGDSPIIGAGLYTDNAVGSAGATGRGEAVIQVSGSRTIVARMEAGDTPAEACMKVLKMIADHTRPRRLLDDQGRPKFGVTVYALRKDGAFASASLWGSNADPVKFAVCDSRGPRLEPCAFLFERKP